VFKVSKKVFKLEFVVLIQVVMEIVYTSYLMYDKLMILLYRLQQCRMIYLYKNVIKNLHLHSAAQYCTSVKDKDKHLSQVYLKA